MYILFGFIHISTCAAQDSICVRVKIEIDQELTLERQGFEARMNIRNGGPVALENINVAVNFLDKDSNPVVASSDTNNTTAKFYMRLTSSATLPERVAGGGEEKLRWLIVPAPDSAGSDPTGTLYYVGAKLTYTSGGAESIIDVTADSIRVAPMPMLTLDYFLPYDVYGDDPFTAMIEPPIPFFLGVRVRNSGFGTARQVKIESSQPRIVENKQGLLINFKIEGSEVNGILSTPSLLTDFGDIVANRSGVARWTMTTSLYGRFTEFNATFTHADELGGQLTSLITGVNTHRLIRDVLVDLSGRDTVRDFLARDGETLNVYESENNDSPVADLSAFSSISGDGTLRTVTVPPSVGFSYVKLTDPHSGTMAITSVTRSDGKPIHSNNAWRSSTYRPEVQQWSYFLNLFDTNNVAGAAYTVNFGLPGGGNRAPVLRQPAGRVTTVGNPVGFIVEATDQDGDPLTLTADAMPVGATFSDDGQGVGTFYWTPAPAQIGNFPLRFTASDGHLTDRATSVITVSDGGLLRGWKNRYWPGISDLAIIGNDIDFDDDELTNLIEFALGLDPTDATSEGGPEIGTAEFAGQTYLSLSYVGRTDDPNLTITVVASDSSVAPTAGWEVLTQTVPADQSNVPSGFRRTTVRDDQPIDGTRQKRFLRLKVSTQEEP